MTLPAASKRCARRDAAVGSIGRCLHAVLASARAAVVASVLALSTSQAIAAAAVALVTDVQGRAQMLGKPNAPLEVLAELMPGAEFSLDAGGRVVMVHSTSGLEFTLLGPGEFRWTASGAQSVRAGRISTREPLGGALREVRLRTGRLTQASIAMRGSASAGPMAPTSPAPQGTIVQLSPASTWLLEPPASFRWQPVAGARVFEFELTDDRGTVLYRTGAAEATQVTLPSSVVLLPARSYAWQVRTSLEDGRVLEGWTEFAIAGEAMLDRVRAAQPGVEATFADRLLYTALLDEWGLRELAQARWRELARERPEAARLALRSNL